MDPIHQFEIKDVMPLIKIGARELHLTNSAIYMVVSVALIIVLMLGVSKPLSDQRGGIRLLHIKVLLSLC